MCVTRPQGLSDAVPPSRFVMNHLGTPQCTAAQLLTEHDNNKVLYQDLLSSL